MPHSIHPRRCLLRLLQQNLGHPPTCPMSPDNCCTGCCGHYRDRNTGSNAEPAVEDWIRTSERDLAACIRWRQTDAVHELPKRGINVEFVRAVFAHHDAPPTGSAEMPARCHPPCPLPRGSYQRGLMERGTY